MKTVSLCSKDDGCCPVVKLEEDFVRIGEEGNLCTLKREEWESLRAKIFRGEL